MVKLLLVHIQVSYGFKNYAVNIKYALICDCKLLLKMLHNLSFSSLYEAHRASSLTDPMVAALTRSLPLDAHLKHNNC
jgi:hypothetical protein